MTITRLWQAGAEIQHVGELEQSTTRGGSTPPTISSTKAKTGTYSWRNNTDYPLGKTVSTTQIRAGVFMNHNSFNTPFGSHYVYFMYTEGTYFIVVRYNSTNGVELVVNGTVRDTETLANVMPNTDQWYHMAMSVKSHSSTGFVSFYVDGVQKLTWTGDTGSALTGVFFAGTTNSGFALFTSYAYFDDFYVDDTVGESDAAPPSPRFPFLIENGAGHYTNWSVNTGANTAALDDSGAPDDDATYTYATASGVKDSFALTNTTAGVTVPSGYSIAAVIPVAWVRKTDSGAASTLKLGTRLSSTDSVGSASALATSYGLVMERQTTKPGGGAWTESDVDAAEVYLESAGSY